MVDIVYRRGVEIPAAGLWLDPRESAALAFVSHAHSDHTGRHARTIATPLTLRLMEARMGTLGGQLISMEFGEERDFGTFALRLLPAGHVLGSAQCFFENDAGTLLYTGDFKLRAGVSSEAAGSCPAETLIMETTYGLPRYVFPPAEEVISDIVKFCHEALEDGDVPVLLGYSLGKSQEILASLAGAGLTAMLHGSMTALMPVYEAAGVVFPAFVPWKPAEADGHVLLCPPALVGSRALSAIPRRRVAAVTGWALDPGAVHRWRCDAAFPLSDHAGFDDLLRHVENVGPRRVLTLHGFAVEFARELRERGVEAWALTGANQLELDLPGSRVVIASPAMGREAAVGGPESLLQLAATGDAIAALTGRLAKIRILAAYFQALDTENLRQAAIWLTGRVFPSSDDAPHGAGWAVVKRALLEASGMPEGDFRQISRRWNDAGRTAGEVLGGRDGEEEVSLGETMALFRALRAARGPAAKTGQLAAFFRRVPVDVSRYVVKILSGDLRIGLKEGLVEEAVAAACGIEADAVREANMLVGDLGEVAVCAREGRLDEIRLRVGRPLKCMLAAPEPTAEAVWTRLDGNVWLDEKFDGIRAQLHVFPGRADLFSRDLHRISETFPEIVQTAARMGREFVADGEILAWKDGRPAGFFELQKRLGRAGGDLFLGAEIPVIFMAFDLLHVDGCTILSRPLAERRERLEALGLRGPLQTARVRVASGVEEIERAFDAARAAGHEGLIAKDPESIYSPGRRGGAWIKLKKQFATLDVVVTAVEYGHGRRREVLSDYTFAVRDEATGHLVTIGKAYSGLTDREIADLTVHFLARARRQQGNRIEVEPDVVLEIAFDSIRASARHASGLALRFPRIVRIRHDKTPQETDTVASARRLAGL